MSNGKINTLRARLAFLGAAGLTLAGLMSAGHAESAIELPIASTPIAQEANAPRFVPSEEAEFQERFAPVAKAEATAIPNHAVDITTIEPAEPDARHLGTGVASYYGRGFAGRPTANGERFNPRALTAAHRTLPFGSQVRVTNTRNGKSVVVRINDRGPFHGGRQIDLSRGAAEQIGLVARGHGRVEMELLTG